MSAIKHNSYEGGAVQSLGFETAKGESATVGVIGEAGEYDFGIAERDEFIKILDDGVILLPDGERRTRNSKGPFVFLKGKPISFRTEGPVAYFCLYGD